MKPWIAVLSASAALACVLGCATPHDGSSSVPVRVALVGGDTVLVQGQEVKVAALGRRLKSLGAGAETPIAVSIPEGAPKAELASLTRRLAEAGFHRVVFVKPRQVTVATKQP